MSGNHIALFPSIFFIYDILRNKVNMIFFLLGRACNFHIIIFLLMNFLEFQVDKVATSNVWRAFIIFTFVDILENCITIKRYYNTCVYVTHHCEDITILVFTWPITIKILQNPFWRHILRIQWNLKIYFYPRLCNCS